jgi:hypothetical protein
MPIPKGRPRPIYYKRDGSLTYEARALIWAMRHGKKDRPPCTLAGVFRDMSEGAPAKFAKSFFKHCPDEGW